MKTNTPLVLAAGFAAAIISANAQLIINGGFESPDTTSFITINAGQKTIAPWVVGLHSVDVGDAVGNGFIVGPAFEGGQFLDLNGFQRGRITQTFATTPGALYTLTFAYANNYYDSLTTASATVRLFDSSGDRLKQTISHGDSVAGDYHWAVFNEQFTALESTTRLQFTSTSDTDGHVGGIMLDAVQVFEGPALQILSITHAGNGSVVLAARGIPKGVHRIQASVDLSAGSFVDLATVSADAAGLFQFEDTRTSLTKGFYRIVLP